jgi:hypothetical protein
MKRTTDRDEPSIDIDTYASFLHNEFPSITIDKLKTVRIDVLQVSYFHIIHIRNLRLDDDIIKSHLSGLESQLQEIVKIDKPESVNVTDDVSGVSVTPDTTKSDTTHNTEKLKGLFLDMFFDFFIFYEKIWGSLPDDEKKKKDYFRYVREQLKKVQGLPTTFHENMDYLSRLDITDPTKQHIRNILNNSFLDVDEKWIIPPLFSETYEIDAFTHFIDTVVAPAHQAGGTNTYIKNKSTQYSSLITSKKCASTLRRRKSRTAAVSRRNRRRRTARK